ncbi:cysteine desulfurase IscS [Francisella halioticida]|uniref:aminotransferase class V-fold PLP-dependent enzyme n=1 Tax=Francisella halioticida TaxID=549298 RepID=UPI001AF3B6D1|nr:aminotransferase class V-fold PLP-dependent enzyme [Francisella halioticida]BCD91213.1 cysteine desulfurase IscS [Francisella halioticida]
MAMITDEVLKEQIGQGVLLVDIRSYQEYLVDIIPSAIHISEFLINYDKYSYHKSVAIYCETAGRSSKVHSFFKNLFDDANCLLGGISNWRENGNKTIIPPELEYFNFDKVLFFNYAATTPVFHEVVEEMQKYMEIDTYFANPASTHYLGILAKKKIDESEKKISEFINASSGNIVWTSGATESNNLAIKGFLESSEKKKRHIITTSIEHKAVLDVCKYLSHKDSSISVSYLKVDNHGRINLNELRNLIRSDTLLISIMAVNNEIGVANPLEEIGKIAKENSITFHVDAAQGIGKVEIDVQKMNIDMLSMSAHKCYGPKGIGALYVANDIQLEEQIHGGGHQNGMRSGTLSTQQIVAFASAIELLKEKIDLAKLKRYREFVVESLSKFDNVIVNTPLEQSYADILSVTVKGVPGDILFTLMPDFALSMSSACTSNADKPSHVLSAIGLDPRQAANTLRISFGYYTTDNDIEKLVKSLEKNIEVLRKIKKFH